MIEILAGFLSGVISGMGIGGGMVLIPSLVFFKGISQHSAQAINLAYFIPTATISLFVHWKNKNLEWKKILFVILSGVPFSILGAFLALRITPSLLGKIFGGFLLLFGIKEVYDGFTNKK